MTYERESPDLASFEQETDEVGLDFARRDQESRLTRVESLEQEIRKLSPQELAELRDWFLEYDAELWDRQIEEDARAGRLDRLAKKALESYHAGKHTELYEDDLELSEDDLKGSGLTAKEIAASPEIGAWADDDLESGAEYVEKLRRVG